MTTRAWESSASPACTFPSSRHSTRPRCRQRTCPGPLVLSVAELREGGCLGSRLHSQWPKGNTDLPPGNFLASPAVTGKLLSGWVKAKGSNCFSEVKDSLAVGTCVHGQDRAPSFSRGNKPHLLGYAAHLVWLCAVLGPGKGYAAEPAVLITGNEQRRIVACHFEPMGGRG